MVERAGVGALVAVLCLAATPVPSAAHTVRLDPPVVPIGGLALLRTDAPVVDGTFDGKRLRFFTASEGFVALVGVDLDRHSGRYPIEVRCRDGTRLRAALEVHDKVFPEERLKVPAPYVEPDAATLRRIDRERRLLDALWKRNTRHRLWRGEFVPPCDGAAGSPFGLRRFFNGEPRSPHAGIDYRAPQGAPVRAANRGRVALARELFFTGNTVVIDHGFGLFTLYVHLSYMGVRRGAMVDKGEVIGRVGMTGRATGPHLHFAVRVADARIDPEALLERDLD
jgi:murein DD-endopeptidase MepM/ murein hydrolase activator NlpD